ncbi:hypothetical protein SLE2022_254340 [Rubroshorea leprosula]
MRRHQGRKKIKKFNGEKRRMGSRKGFKRPINEVGGRVRVLRRLVPNGAAFGSRWASQRDGNLYPVLTNESKVSAVLASWGCIKESDFLWAWVISNGFYFELQNIGFFLEFSVKLFSCHRPNGSG